MGREEVEICEIALLEPTSGDGDGVGRLGTRWSLERDRSACQELRVEFLYK